MGVSPRASYDKMTSIFTIGGLNLFEGITHFWGLGPHGTYVHFLVGVLVLYIICVAMPQKVASLQAA